MREEFDNILEDYGHYILLVRQNKKVELPKSYDASLGLGCAYTIEKHLCRSMTASIPETLPRMQQGRNAGEMAISSKMFYLRYDVRPSKGDLIVEPSWIDDQPVIDEYTAIYEINYPEPFRGDNGRIEYFRAACELNPVEATLRLKRIAGENYIIIDRGE